MTGNLTEQGTDFDVDELYAAYCEFMNDARRSLIEHAPNAQCQFGMRRLAHIMTKTEFKWCLSVLSPTERVSYRDRISRGWLDGKESTGQSR